MITGVPPGVVGSGSLRILDGERTFSFVGLGCEDGGGSRPLIHFVGPGAGDVHVSGLRGESHLEEVGVDILIEDQEQVRMAFLLLFKLRCSLKV